MIEQISFKNFKGFRELKDLKIKPITILCGINSCGKSTILQNILLAKQTLESNNPGQALLLNGRFVRLGNFKNIIFEKNLKNDLIFEYIFKIDENNLKGPRNPESKISPYILKSLVSKESIGKDNVYFINYKIIFSPKSDDSSSKKYIFPILIKEISFNIETKTKKGKVIQESSVNLYSKEKNIYNMEWKRIPPKFALEIKKKGKFDSSNLPVEINFKNFFPSIIINEDSNFYDELFMEIDAINNVFENLSNILNYIFSSYSYIGPLREEPFRRYIYEEEILEIGNKGENSAHVFLLEQDKLLKDHYFYNNGSFETTDEIILSQALMSWLDIMNIKHFKLEALKDSEIMTLTLNSATSEKVRVNIADVGFGVSQVFPIILEGLRIPRRNTLLLEQPEIHLHPKLQMQMADYFITLALSKKNVIAETHSEHIINRLVRRIIEDESSSLKDLIAIYFIHQSEFNETIYEEICIDEKRGILNWPEDFFDQSANEKEQIIRAGIEKRRRGR